MTATLHPQTQAQAVAEERQNTAALLHRVRSTPMKVRYVTKGVPRAKNHRKASSVNILRRIRVEAIRIGRRIGR
ncbi:MAG TPA: hypothetical protein VIM11_17525 [Tepidisphaeraceae bacterium]|jgi:hypothetical protein